MVGLFAMTWKKDNFVATGSATYTISEGGDLARMRSKLNWTHFCTLISVNDEDGGIIG